MLRLGQYWSLVVSVIPVAFTGAAAEWPRWRGPNMDGVAPDAPRLLAWPQSGLRVVWRASVGTGFSSLAVSGGRVFTLGNSNGQDSVYCFDTESGGVRWSHTYDCPLDPNLYQGGPSATPTVEGDVVYTLSKFGQLFCFRVTDGSIVWQRDLLDDFSIEKPEWGFGGSPVIEGTRLLLSAGGHGLALDKSNGQLIWLSNTRRAGYSTIIPFDLNGSRVGVMLGYTNVVAMSLDDGGFLWQQFWRSIFDMNCPDPLVYRGRIFVTSVSKSARMLRPDNGQPDTAYPVIDLKTHLSPGIILSDHLYAFHGDAERSGEFRCVDLRNGAVRWSTPLPIGSHIAADNKLLIITGGGELILAQANPTAFQIISRVPVLTGRCWTMPALSGDRLYLRNAAGDVLSLQLPVEAPPRLEIQALPASVSLSWPTSAVGFALEATPQFAPTGSWTPLTNPAASAGDRYRVTVAPTETNRFFRLKRP